MKRNTTKRRQRKRRWERINLPQNASSSLIGIGAPAMFGLGFILVRESVILIRKFHPIAQPVDGISVHQASRFRIYNRHTDPRGSVQHCCVRFCCVLCHLCGEKQNRSLGVEHTNRLPKCDYLSTAHHTFRQICFHLQAIRIVSPVPLC